MTFPENVVAAVTLMVALPVELLATVMVDGLKDMVNCCTLTVSVVA